MITRMDKEDILLLTDKGLAVFKYYIPFSFKLGRNFLNPLYKDSKASCNAYFDRRNGMYKMKDFGNDDYSGDCFALVGKLNGLNCKEPKDFVQILAIIDRDMHLGLSDKFEMRISSTTSVPVIAEVTHVPKKELYGCGTCLLGRKWYHARGAEIVPGGFVEEVQQRE